MIIIATCNKNVCKNGDHNNLFGIFSSSIYTRANIVIGRCANGEDNLDYARERDEESGGIVSSRSETIPIIPMFCEDQNRNIATPPIKAKKDRLECRAPDVRNHPSPRG
jgi:hypothetical protein